MRQQSYTMRHMVITGGKPYIYDLIPLTALLEQQYYGCQIETSGTYEIRCSVKTWVMVSPKVNMRDGMKMLDQVLQRADEVKHLVARELDIEALDVLLATLHDKSSVSSRYNRLARRKRRPINVLQPTLHAIDGYRCRLISTSILPNFTESIPQYPAIRSMSEGKYSIRGILARTPIRY